MEWNLLHLSLVLTYACRSCPGYLQYSAAAFQFLILAVISAWKALTGFGKTQNAKKFSNLPFSAKRQWDANSFSWSVFFLHFCAQSKLLQRNSTNARRRAGEPFQSEWSKCCSCSQSEQTHSSRCILPATQWLNYSVTFVSTIYGCNCDAFHCRSV